MSIALMTKVWESSPYEGSKLLIHLAMADHANNEGRFYISQASLANKARCSIEYVRQTVRLMVQDNWLIIEKRGSSKGRATEYRLLLNSVGDRQQANSPTLDAQLPNSEPLTPQLSPVSTIIINHNKSTIKEAARKAASTWWESLDTKPIGKNAWHALLKVCEAALDMDYSEQQILEALHAIGTVPSIAQMDRQLRKIQPQQFISARQQRLARGLDSINLADGQPLQIGFQ